ncbi:protein kinase [Acanthamoeba castellanii str. Neff]|uniref:Protein kinase n=1 Tax=Acanthamoeba castellanii (strain ATCC 30010 / Neff) TaxID=1257118 RepID=L8GN46_ACACF|nr:protein kinase [Acanthamoeba castellanii str. Neff]ELR13641.1 protein kinase [Acanthamoeba castellanii str. Neff]
MSFLKRMVGERKEKAPEPLKRREKTIGNYAIIKTIGEGRYGKVKLAEHIVTRKKVAVKIMKKAQMEAADLARIKRELRVMTVLDHPNIVKLYQVIDTPETTCIVMEFCSGGDLYDYISTYRRLSVPNALKLFRQIVAGLLYCHQHLVIHRDIKPENILLTEDLQVKIGDFGFSRSFNPHAAMETACGSLTYAAPEVIAGKGYLGPKADVWSLGCVLYVLLTGALPFDGANDFEVIPKIRKGKFQDSTFLNEDNMRELITCMLNPDPNKRANLEDIQKHPWTWSDKSMLAMLVRPFSNALTSRRKMGVRLGRVYGDAQSAQGQRVEEAGVESGDSELNDPTLPKEVRGSTRNRGKSMSDRNENNLIEPMRRKRKSGEMKPQNGAANAHQGGGGARTRAAAGRREGEPLYGTVYDSRSILGEYDEMDLVAMMAERMDEREMAELELELQMEIEAERSRRKSSSLASDEPDDDGDSRPGFESKEQSTVSDSGESSATGERRNRSRSVGSRKASNSLGSSSSSSSSSSSGGGGSGSGGGSGLVRGRSRKGSMGAHRSSNESGDRESSGSTNLSRPSHGSPSPSSSRESSGAHSTRREEAGAEPDRRNSRGKRVPDRLMKRDSKEDSKSGPPSPSSSSSTTSPLVSPSSSQSHMATVVGRDRSQSTAGATRDNIMSMLGFRPRTRDQRSQSVFEPPTVDASIIEEPVSGRGRSRSRSHSMSAAEEPPLDPANKKTTKWKKGSSRGSPLTNSQPASPSGDEEEEPGTQSPKRGGPSPASSIIERYARKKRASGSPQGMSNSAGVPATSSSGVSAVMTNSGELERRPTMLSRLKNITKKTPKNQQHLVMTRKRSFSTEDAINLAKERVLASREDIDNGTQEEDQEAALRHSTA